MSCVAHAEPVERAQQEDVRIGAAGDRHALALEIGRPGWIGESLGVTSAVHSGRE